MAGIIGIDGLGRTGSRTRLANRRSAESDTTRPSLRTLILWIPHQVYQKGCKVNMMLMSSCDNRVPNRCIYTIIHITSSNQNRWQSNTLDQMIWIRRWLVLKVKHSGLGLYPSCSCCIRVRENSVPKWISHPTHLPYQEMLDYEVCCNYLPISEVNWLLILWIFSWKEMEPLTGPSRCS